MDIFGFSAFVQALSFTSGDGFLQESELRHVMKACMEENGMKFDEKDIESLTKILYQDAAGEDSRGGITIDDIKEELGKHEGLLENLSIR